MAEHREPEIWKSIPGYEGLYEVSNHGRVKRLARIRQSDNAKLKEIVFKEYYDSSGYPMIKLISKNKQKMFKIHRLVAEVFIKNELNRNQINHIDSDKTNNYYKNLEWVNHRENQTHKWVKISTVSKYNCVYKKTDSKRRKPWYSMIHLNGQRTYLGCFCTEREAYQAYLHALKQYNLTNKYAS